MFHNKYFVTILVLAALLLSACQPITANIPAPAKATHTIAWPGPRNYQQMAYDAESKRIILLGGQLGSMVPLTDTWAYDPAAATWQAMRPRVAPPASEGPLAYADKADRMLYLATLDGMTFGPLNETWTYDYNSNTWAKLTPAQSPTPGMVGARMVYDSESDRMILFGGYDIPKNGYFNETWVFDFAANTWTQMKPQIAPPGTNFHSMIYDSQADRVLMWGSVSDDRLWSYDYNSDTWAEVTDRGTPPLTDYTRMVYVPELRQSILFGGVDVPKEAPQGSTWIYDHMSKQWQKLTLANAPAPRGWHSMIYEPVSKQILLFGGGLDRNRAYGDLWRFDPIAQTWTDITPVSAPRIAVAPATVGFFVTGADKRAAVEHKWFAFYDLPAMDKTHVASLTYKDSLALDLYYPPDFDFAKPLPAVVFIHGVDLPELSRTLKDDGPYVSWGQLVAADGMVGVLYDATKPGEDIVDVLNYLHANAAVLGIDPQRTCIWASSGNPPPALEAMTQADAAYYAGLRCAVVLYGATKRTAGQFPPGFSLMAVRVGHDEPGFSSMMTDLINWAQAEKVSVTVVDYAEGPHAFDVFLDTPRTREIIGQVLGFLQTQLQVKK
ncbi:MAG: kelch repeat-containing protein [Caldilineaceae bacterium]